MHEAQLYDANVFLTLSYSDEYLPRSLSLEYDDFQKFMKRLRKRVRGVSVAPNGDRPIRFFCAGEYGDKYKRPHFHALLFNCWFVDSVRLYNGTYRSALAEDLWSRGNVVIGDVTPRSASYCAGYTMNKVYRNVDHYEDVVNLRTGEVTARRPEFCTMSRRPGIGAWWYDRFGADLFPMDSAVSEGKKYKVPRYYYKKLVLSDPALGEEIAQKRYLRARAVPLEESSEQRRLDREAVAAARLLLFSERSH